MSDEYKEKLRSLSLLGPRSEVGPKVTTDVHDHHTVDVIEHWGDRQDVVVKPDTYALKVNVEETS